MLLRFGVANHKSIREYQELVLTALRPFDERLIMPVSTIDESVVPVTALYGANASGKSNLLDAMHAFRRMVLGSHKNFDASDRIPRSPFLLDNHSSQEPTRFECAFTLDSGSVESGLGKVPVYDLVVEFTDFEIRHEVLYRSVQGKRRSTHTLYERETTNGRVRVDFGAQLQGENRLIAKVTRPNSLFLSAAAQNNHALLTEIHKWFYEAWEGSFPEGPMSESAIAARITAHRHRQWFKSLLRQADFAVDGVQIGTGEASEQNLQLVQKAAEVVGHVDGNPLLADDRTYREANLGSSRLRLLHETDDGVSPLDYESESRGTKMFLKLLLPAVDVLSSGGLLVVDELHSTLHSRLAHAFVSLFLDPESNKHGSQLVFSTHDVTLLAPGMLHQDEVWLVEKDLKGVSSLVPLTDFRTLDNVERAYRGGRLGGTPYIDEFLPHAYS